LRIDTDEVAFLNATELDRYFSRRDAVADVEWPSWIVPGWVKGWIPKTAPSRVHKIALPRQPVLFDREQIEPEIHINYLLLILGGDEPLPEAGKKPFRVNSHLGCIAHLQTWRKLQASEKRAKFYALKYIREHGIPWIAELRGRRISDVNEIFEFVSPDAFRDVLNVTRHGAQRLYSADLVVTPSPLNPVQESTFSGCYTAMLEDMAHFNRSMVQDGLHFATSLPFAIDLTDDRRIESATEGDALRLAFNCEINGADVRLNVIRATDPYFTATRLQTRLIGKDELEVVFPTKLLSRPFLRRQVQFRLQTNVPGAVRRFVVGRSNFGTAAASQPSI
jgi:hypothetical protein